MLVLPLETALALAVMALVADALLGEPGWLYRRVPHPVVALGRLIAALEARAWRPEQPPGQRRLRGALLVAVVVAVACFVGAGLGWLATRGPAGLMAAGLLCSTLLAQRSLVEHVAAVADGLDANLSEGRLAVGRIVGRDPERLDGAGVARAAIESAAENVSDGVVAPALWLLLLGPIGLCAYKAINTMDSMLGYRSERYLYFGWAAARLDDLVNHLPARLTALLLLLAAGRPQAWRRVAAEAPKHRSPNAGWPEAATALILDLRLAGPRIYAAGRIDDPWIGDGRAVATAADVRAAVRLLWRAWGLLVLILVGSLLVPLAILASA